MKPLRLIIPALLLATGLFAVFEEDGTAGTDANLLTKLPAGSRAMAMGNAAVAIADDAGAAAWNPAGLSLVSDVSIMLDAHTYAENRHMTGFFTVFPLVDWEKIRGKRSAAQVAIDQYQKTKELIKQADQNTKNDKTDTNEPAFDSNEPEFENAPAAPKNGDRPKDLPGNQRRQAFGLALVSHIDSGIPGYSINGDYLGDFSFFSSILYLTYSREITDNLFLGGSLKAYNHSNVTRSIGGGSDFSFGFGTDFGVRYHLLDMFQLGLTTVDPLALIRWQHADPEPLRGWSMVSPLLRYGIAFSSRKLTSGKGGAVATAGVAFSHDLLTPSYTVHIGAEADLPVQGESGLLNRVAFRGGFDNGTLTLGTGFDLHHLTIDYGYRLGTHQERGLHSVAATLCF